MARRLFHLQKVFYEKSKVYCEEWEKDLRNVRDPVKAHQRLNASREEMIIAYREMKAEEKNEVAS